MRHGSDCWAVGTQARSARPFAAATVALTGALALAAGSAPPAMAQQAGQTAGVTHGDMSSGSGGARPDSPARGGVGSAPGASALPASPQRDEGARAAIPPDDASHSATPPPPG